jgi:hypothetical protein
MNTLRNPFPAKHGLERLLLLGASAMLLLATWLPAIEIKGFDTFALETMAMWATRAARFTLVAVILCLPIRPLGVARWWMALSVGILIGPLADMAVRAVDLAKIMMETSGPGDITELIVIRTGTWVCATGLVLWLLDLAALLAGRFRAWRGARS